MKTRCPCCGTTLSLDALVAHDGARDALNAAFKISGELGAAIIKYLGLFRSETRELSLDRVAKLLNELVPDIQAQRISHDRRTYETPVAAWIWSIEQVLAVRSQGRLKTPLKGHGYLYTVLTTWRPSAGAVIAHEQQQQGTSQSKTVSAVLALEAMKNA